MITSREDVRTVTALWGMQSKVHFHTHTHHLLCTFSHALEHTFHSRRSRKIPRDRAWSTAPRNDPVGWIWQAESQLNRASNNKVQCWTILAYVGYHWTPLNTIGRSVNSSVLDIGKIAAALGWPPVKWREATVISSFNHQATIYVRRADRHARLISGIALTNHTWKHASSCT